MHQLPNLKHLHALCAVAKFHNISKASESVFLSQSAVSQALAKLAQFLDAPLVVRKGVGVALTAEATAYVYRAERAFELLKNGLDELLKNQPLKNQATPNKKSEYLLHHLTHTQLKAFIMVSETHNYTHASNLLNTSQSAIYRSIQELQSLLNTQLFEKTSQGIQLSKLGLVFYQYCKLAIAELTQGQMDIEILQNKEVGKIIIGCMPLARHELLPSAINLFSQTYPKVDLQIVEMPYDDMLRQLKLGEIDFLIGALRPISDTPDIVQECLFYANLCIVADINHHLANQTNISLDDLLQYTWVLPNKNTPTRNRFEQLIENSDKKLTIIECSSMAMVRGLLKNSDRLALISKEQITMELDLNLLTVIDYKFNDTPREIGITMRENWVGSQIHNDFLECLQTASRTHGGLQG